MLIMTLLIHSAHIIIVERLRIITPEQSGRINTDPDESR
jgi:hypothetical protein